MQHIIEIEDLSFAYQEASVLRHVSFCVNAGDFVGIIGPNGGGKTTLLKLILGILKPSSGTIRVFGQTPPADLSRIAYVPQAMRFDKQFPISVLEVVLLGRLSQLPWYGRYSQADIQAARDALERVGLLSLQNHAFGTLSGGQAQRTLIARALVSNPALLLLDEPTASIDAQAQADIYRILTELRGSMTIVMVTHDLEAAIKYVQSVICVQQTIKVFTPQEVCEHFAIGLYHPPLVNRIRNPS